MGSFKIPILRKKGSVQDLLFILIALFIFAMIFVIGYKIGMLVNDGIQSSNAFSSAAKVRTEELISTRLPALFNYGFVFVMIIFWLGALISAYLSDTNPAFFIIGFLFIVVFVVIAGMMANIYATFSAASSVSAEAAKFTIIEYIFQHYLAISLVMGFSVLGVTFAKLKMT